ncbi:MAG: hypothetical protein K6T16_01160 [Candidatus Pacearchaeota archaeon]|nr:hypothetical protein [Candidatus Pacearchaeota archaeon]
MPELIDTIVKDTKTRQVLFGPKSALKKLRAARDSIERIYVSNDCPAEILRNLKANFSEVIHTEMSKEELRELCKKPFNISVISVLREKEELGEKVKESKKEKKAKSGNSRKKSKEEEKKQ